MVVMDEISNIRNFFESHQVRLSSVWLESCVNWCKEENLPVNYTIKDLQLKVYEQWLLLDLRDVEVPCLPPEISNKKQDTLNDQEVESSKRALLLTLTDGVQEVEAMEYKPIPCLNLNLTPGIKIRLIGPISIRRGRLMLQNQNVKVLGGEVEDLIISNAAENILAKILKLPLNPKPQVIEETLLNANKDMFDDTGAAINRIIPQCQNNLITKGVIQPPVVNRNNQQNQQAIGNGSSTSITKPVRQIQNNAIGISDEEEMKLAEEMEILMEMEKEFEEPRAKRRKSDSRTPDMFDDMDVDDYDFSKIDIPDTIIKTNKDTNKTPVVKETNIQKISSPINIDLSASLEQDNEVFENLDIESHLDKIDDKVNKVHETEFSTPQKRAILEKKLTPPKSVILTIEKLLKNIPNISNGKFKIKAKFKSIVEKLTVADDEFYLVIKVEDDSGDITVRIHSDVVTDLAEYCPIALLSLKSSIEENNKESQQKVLEVSQ
ncbi:hypothetical protein NQ314_010927 [Rhamnusium bicolor]|uniref:RecQ-mediated genome instability protein 1 n=1 Tax=Rhamnusium bicolor TaxID=1586634 RepID=A0AAV8XN15_9CUCU|nr:hypothetical protein NQ314_010927 [Rhamnusium bicolor]